MATTAARAASVACALLFASVPAERAPAQPPLPIPTQPSSVHEVKAAFLYHFGTYVQWPEAALPEDVMTITVLGDGVVAAELERVAIGRAIQGRPVRVREADGLEELGHEALLYIGPAENHRLAEVLAHVGGRPTLVVTDATDALATGAMINFRILDNRVRFEIAVEPAERVGLTLSSRLLAAAERVDTSGECELGCPRDRIDLE